MATQSPDSMLLLDRAAVQHCVGKLDPIAIIEEALVYHAKGLTDIPDEGYLAWKNTEGAYCRSLAMLGSLSGKMPPVYGLKVINAALSNPKHGIPRAGGVSFLFDSETARPNLIADAAYLSALRTAAYTIVSLRFLGPESFEAISIIGCGVLAKAHLELVAKYFPQVRTFHLYDLNQEVALVLADWWLQQVPSNCVQIHTEPRAAIEASPVLITVTTSSVPYIPVSWLPSGSFVAHVSLDDLQPDAFMTAEAIFVDDIDLVRDNPRRILGRLIQDGEIVPPDGPVNGRPRIVGTLGEVIAGTAKAVRPGQGHIVSNPFGMSILDIVLLDAVHSVAKQLGIGDTLNLVRED